MTLTIKNSIIFPYSEETGTFFHPKLTLAPKNAKLMMTIQKIKDSDYFGPVEITYSQDNGNSWAKPENIPTLGWNTFDNGLQEGVCDVVPDYHPQSKTVLAIGHNVYYKNEKLYDSLADSQKEDGPVLQRYIVYTVMDKYGKWNGTRKRLEYSDFANCSMFSCGCSQKIMLHDGNILIPITFGHFDRKDRQVSSLLCSFDGNTLTPLKRGNILENPVGRGLLEPSIIEFQNKYYMTIRAEDERGYLSISDDGLNWKPIKAWQWEDGTPLIMSTTQQHWLKLGGKLYLIYTRRNGQNKKIMRWRSPLLIAEFDTESLCLKKSSEQIVLPMRGDLDKPDTVGLMGNFHPSAISDNEAIVTVGEMRPNMGFSGDTLLARITV